MKHALRFLRLRIDIYRNKHPKMTNLKSLIIEKEDIASIAFHLARKTAVHGLRDQYKTYPEPIRIKQNGQTRSVEKRYFNLFELMFSSSVAAHNSNTYVLDPQCCGGSSLVSPSAPRVAGTSQVSK